MKMCKFFLAFRNTKRLQYLIKNFPPKQTMTLMCVTKMKKNFFYEKNNSLFEGAWECQIFVVSIVFPSSFQWVLNMFPNSQCIPQHFPNISSHLSHIVQAQSSNLITYIVIWRRLQHFYFGTIQSLISFWWWANWRCPSVMITSNQVAPLETERDLSSCNKTETKTLLQSSFFFELLFGLLVSHMGWHRKSQKLERSIRVQEKFSKYWIHLANIDLAKKIAKKCGSR
jgi:hypothetical protein